MLRVTYDEMYGEFVRALMKKGFSRERAELCATLFADASLDGVYSHGLNRFPRFIDCIDEGIVDVNAEPEKVESLGVLERWDGNLGPGPLNAHRCMGRAIEVARESGVGVVALRNTNHWMRGGSYGRQAAEAGCIGICWTNTMPIMPPWGAKEPRLGNNPLVIAVPHPDGHLVLDIAMAQFSGGRLQTHWLRSEKLPVPGGYDKEGKLTNDPKAIQESRRPLPIGCWKGAGLALMIDLVAALLSGGVTTYEIGKQRGEYGVSQVFIAFDTSGSAVESRARELINEVLDDLHSAALVSDDDRILYPGERVLETRRENLAFGIPVVKEFWEKVKAM